jgi:hypothetical protein
MFNATQKLSCKASYKTPFFLIVKLLFGLVLNCNIDYLWWDGFIPIVVGQRFLRASQNIKTIDFNPHVTLQPTFYFVMHWSTSIVPKFYILVLLHIMKPYIFLKL